MSGNAASTTTDRLIDAAAHVQGGASDVEDERRDNTRHPYDAHVAIRLLGPNGERHGSLIAQACDISEGGMCIASRKMLHPGLHGALLMMRMDGRLALAGVQIHYCRYVGNMMHHSGLKFIPVPDGLSKIEFADQIEEVARLNGVALK